MKFNLSHKSAKALAASIVTQTGTAFADALQLITAIMASKNPIAYLSDIAEVVSIETGSKDAGRIQIGRNTIKLFRYHMDRAYAAQVKASKVGDKLQQYSFKSRKGVVTVESVEVIVTAAMLADNSGKEAGEQAKANRASEQESERNAQLVAQTAEQKDALARVRAELAELRKALKAEQTAHKATRKELATVTAERDALRAEWADATAAA